MPNQVQRSHSGAPEQLDIQVTERLRVDEGRQGRAGPWHDLLRKRRALVRRMRVAIDHRQFPGKAPESKLPRRRKAGRAGPDDQVSRHFQLLIDSDGVLQIPRPRPS
jgi:hypothetical protein